MSLTWIELLGGSFILSFLGAGMRGLVGVLKAAKKEDTNSISKRSIKNDVTKRLSIVGEIFKLKYFIGTAIVGGLAGTCLALLECYVFGVGIVESCAITTLGLMAQGWASIDGLESLLKR